MSASEDKGAPNPSGSTWVVRKGSEVARLGSEPLIIGRSKECDIVLRGENISRRHARIWVEAGNAYVEDLGSTNGVIVDGKKADGATRVSNGGHVTVGRFTLEVAIDLELEKSRTRPLAQTVRRQPIDIRKLDDGHEQTQKDDTLELMGSVARKQLAIGKVGQAEDTLRDLLKGVQMSAASTGLPRKTWKTATELALDLAKASKKGKWLNYVFEISKHDPHALPVDFVAQAMDLLDDIDALELNQLRTYIAAMNRRGGDLNPKLMLKLHELERRAATLK